jgi:hypothetical protein
MHVLTHLTIYMRRVVAALAAVVALSIFCYCAFMLMTVSHAAAYEEARGAMGSLEEELADLEAHYLSATRLLTPESAEALGFVPPIATTAVFTDVPTLSLHQRP